MVVWAVVTWENDEDGRRHDETYGIDEPHMDAALEKIARMVHNPIPRMTPVYVRVFRCDPETYYFRPVEPPPVWKLVKG